MGREIKPRVNAEFERVANAFRQAADQQLEQDRMDTHAVIAILHEKHVEVMAKNEIVYFIRDWQELRNQVRQMIAQDSSRRAIKGRKAARRCRNQEGTL